MQIEFMGRAIRLQGEQGIAYLFPDEVFDLVKWAKDHEFQLLEKQRELELIREKKQQREGKSCREE
jgi:hypothetical protein